MDEEVAPPRRVVTRAGWVWLGLGSVLVAGLFAASIGKSISPYHELATETSFALLVVAGLVVVGVRAGREHLRWFALGVGIALAIAALVVWFLDQLCRGGC